MKIKVGLRFKSIEGPSKGKMFTVTAVSPDSVVSKSEESGRIYVTERGHFEKYIKRVNQYWSNSNKNYKHKKQELKGEVN